MEKRKVLVISTLLMAIILLGVGTLAYFRRIVNGNITGNTGILVFNVNGLTGETTETLSYSLNRSEEEPYVYPGDSGYFDLEITAEGSSTDVYVTLQIIRDNLPDNLKFYTTEDHKSAINTRYIFFEKTGEMSETRRIYWYWDGTKDDINDSLFINTELSARITLSATPMEYGMMKNGSIEETEFWHSSYNDVIQEITFTKDFYGMPEECTKENMCWDISYEENQKYPVYAYIMVHPDAESEVGYFTELLIACEKTVFAPINSKLLFGEFSNLQTINFNNWFNTSKVGSMSSMFSYSRNLEYIDLSNFNTTNVITFDSMFSNIKASSLNLESFDTSSAVDMSNMFNSCDDLETLDLETFDTANVIDMSRMFQGCEKLEILNLGSFDTTNVYSFEFMFEGCINLNSLDLSGFDLTNMRYIGSMFAYCENLTTELTISKLNIYYDSHTSIADHSATNSSAQITLNYTSETSSIVDDIISNKSANSNIVKGKQVSTAKTYTVTLEDATVTTKFGDSNLHEGTRVVLLPTEEYKYISSFKVNGEVVKGNSFNLTEDAIITDVVMYNIIIESDEQVEFYMPETYNCYRFQLSDSTIFKINDVLVRSDRFYIKPDTEGDINIEMIVIVYES